jgi:hypothetical protein
MYSLDVLAENDACLLESQTCEVTQEAAGFTIIER